MKPKHSSASFEAILTILVLFAAGNEGRPISKRVTVTGSVYCDSCMQNTFSKHSYFLQGVDVHVECKLKAGLESERNFTYSLTRKTDKFGIYRIKLPYLNGYECRDSYMMESFCKATVKKNPFSPCNIHGVNTTREMYVISGRGTSCIFSMKPLNYRLPMIVSSICGNESLQSFNNSEFFWPPLQNPWFPLPFPSWPPLPPLPSLPMPHFPPMPFPKPSFPFPLPFSPSQPMPSWPHLPPISSLFPPPQSSSPSPPYSLGDPPSWFPYWGPPSAPPSQSPNQP